MKFNEEQFLFLKKNKLCLIKDLLDDGTIEFVRNDCDVQPGLDRKLGENKKHIT